MKLFAGSSNIPLAEEVAAVSSIPLAKTDISYFANGELRVFIEDSAAEALVLESFAHPVHRSVIEYALICDALTRLGTKSITGIIPWLGYSKQDKVFRPGEPLSVQVIARLIETTATQKIITLDLHKPAIADYFSIPVVNLTAAPLFVDYLSHHELQDTVVVAPDAGAGKSSAKFAGKLGLPVVYSQKTRDLVTGKVSVHGLSSPVNGKNILIFDDMISTGSTLIETSNFLKEAGAQSITICATHHLFVDGVQAKLDQAPIDRLVVTNSVQKPEAIHSPKLTILSIAPLIADVLK